MNVSFNDSFTETRVNSRMSRMKNSIIGSLIGLALFIGSFFLLSWNEGRTIHRYQALEEAQSLVVSIPASTPSNAYNNKVIHFSGKANTNETLVDPVFAVHRQALKLKRSVAMYQWKEKKSTSTHRNSDGTETETTHYDYSKVWSESYIDSNSFKYSQQYRNPPPFDLKSATLVAGKIYVNDIILQNEFVRKINDFKPLPLSGEEWNRLSPSLKTRFKLSNGELYTGPPTQPNIGDVRVSFSKIDPTEISAVGMLQNQQLIAYKAQKGDVALLEYGVVDAAMMFDNAIKENIWIGWAIRVGGFIMMWFGLSLILTPIVTLLDVIPFIGGIASTILGLGIGFATFLLSLALSFVTIAIAWLYYRPIWAIGLFLCAAIILACYFFLSYKRKNIPEGSLKYAEHGSVSGASDGI